MRLWALVAALIFVFAAVLPGPAVAAVGADVGAQPAAGDGVQQPSQGQGSVGGIQPVSPERFAGKLTRLAEALYEAATPVTDALAKTVLALAGVVLVFFLVSGFKVASRAIGTIIAVTVGLLLWYGAPYLVAMIKWLAAWLQS